jgi:AmpD protein
MTRQRGPIRWSNAADGWFDGVRRVASPNFNARPPGMTVDALIIHYISLPPGVFSGDAIERLFLNRISPDDDPRLAPLADLQVSAHLLVRRRGDIVQFVATDLRAWHAGPSTLLGRERCNDFSIGIELEGDGQHPFTCCAHATPCAGWPGTKILRRDENMTRGPALIGAERSEVPRRRA